MAGGPRGHHWQVNAVYANGKPTCGARTEDLAVVSRGARPREWHVGWKARRREVLGPG
jgi:hypothetical protein